MRCVRCNKKINRKLLKLFHNCLNKNCGYAKWVNIPGWKYGFRTETYVVFVRNNFTVIYNKLSNRDIFVRHIDNYKEYSYDLGKYVCTLPRELSPKSNDDDINKYLMLR